MSINDWVSHKSLGSDITSEIILNEETNKKALNFQGTNGEMYFLPKEQYNIRGQLSGCFRLLYTKKTSPPLSEVRIYCMLSEEDVTTQGSCYVASINSNRQVFLRKYTQGLVGDSEVLACLRLPANYNRGVFGLMWTYDPVVRPGVFFRGLLSVKPDKPEDAYRLFDCLDTDNPLITSAGEGFGIYAEGFTDALIERTALHKLQYTNAPGEEGN